MPDPTLLADGLRFAEAPRWLGDRLWFSDVHAYQLKTVRLDGTIDVVADVPGARRASVRCPTAGC